jgi:predicted DNA repair protein MutK
MKLLSVAGTAAMFLVGGGILVHGIPWIERRIEALAGHGGAEAASTFATVVTAVVPTLTSLAVGDGAGALAVALVSLAQRVRRR